MIGNPVLAQHVIHSIWFQHHRRPKKHLSLSLLLIWCDVRQVSKTRTLFLGHVLGRVHGTSLRNLHRCAQTHVPPGQSVPEWASLDTLIHTPYSSYRSLTNVDTRNPSLQG